MPVACWRCGKFSSTALSVCPSCRARLREEVGTPSASLRPVAHSDTSQNLVLMLKFYSVLLAMGVAQGLVVAIARGLKPGIQTLVFIGIAEAVNTLAVVVAWNSIPVSHEPTVYEHDDTRSGLWWLLLPMLAGLVAANVGYHYLLHSWFQVPLIADQLTNDVRLLPWWVLVICVQPAIVEEFFFRQIAFRTIRTTASLRATIVITTAMFGMAHIGTPLSIPMLCVIGLALGYFRTDRHGLWLPIVLHFLHNACVLGVEWWT